MQPNYDEEVEFVETNRERLVKKWGGEAGWDAQKYRHDLKGRGESAGIPHFNLDRKASNTMKSHRLVQYVGKVYGLDVSESLYDKLNTYHFVKGHALNDVEGLVKCAEEVGLDGDEVRDFLLDPAQPGRKEIEKAVALCRQLGIHSIPNFVVGGQYVVSGASGPEEFLEIFSEMERTGEVGKPVFAGVLGVHED